MPPGYVWPDFAYWRWAIVTIRAFWREWSLIYATTNPFLPKSLPMASTLSQRIVRSFLDTTLRPLLAPRRSLGQRLPSFGDGFRRWCGLLSEVCSWAQCMTFQSWYFQFVTKDKALDKSAPKYWVPVLGHCFSC